MDDPDDGLFRVLGPSLTTEERAVVWCSNLSEIGAFQMARRFSELFPDEDFEIVRVEGRFNNGNAICQDTGGCGCCS